MTRSPNVEKFDVFLCHNSEDKVSIRDFAQQLRQQNLVPWLDEEQLIPGRNWLYSLEQDIPKIKTVAVFVGRNGLGPWQKQEISMFLNEFVRRGTPLIPVLLKNAPKQPKLPPILENMTWVDFRRRQPEPFQSLLWGITGNNSYPVQDSQYKMWGITWNRSHSVQDSRYQALEKLLKAQQWISADRETYSLMITAIGREEGDCYYEEEELLNFPYADLKTIDGLWVKYSQGQFGFSVQKKIYVECGGKLDGKQPRPEVWEPFGYRVGWRGVQWDIGKLNEGDPLSFPQGIFPGVWVGMMWVLGGVGLDWFVFLFSRRDL
jgi:GUN4-like/TIR domain